MTQRETPAEHRFPTKVDASDRLYQSLRPVHWCPSCRKILGVDEIVSKNHTCEDIHVRFDLDPDSAHKLPIVPGLVPALQRISFVAWTTTPWSLPANTALAVNADLDYQFVRGDNDDVFVVAKPLRLEFLRTLGKRDGKAICTVKGRHLEFVHTRHPLENRASPVVLSSHVLPTVGTGIVHIAPGLGGDDFVVGKAYNLVMLCPFQDDGTLSHEAGRFAGMSCDAADAAVVEELRANDTLLRHGRFDRQYMHCGHCHAPVLERVAVDPA
jgi:isoleucyl-tRNA synthetase